MLWELTWLVDISPHSITFAVFEPVSPLLKQRVIRPSWSLGRFHGQVIVSTAVAGGSHFFLNGKYTEPSSTPCSGPSSKSFCFSPSPFSCFPRSWQPLGDWRMHLAGTDIFHLLLYVGMVRIAGLHLLTPFPLLSCLTCPLLPGEPCLR